MKHFSELQLQIIDLALKEFKEGHAIYGQGLLHNTTAGEWLYEKLIDEMKDDNTFDKHDEFFHVTDELKKKFWKECGAGTVIKVFASQLDKKIHTEEMLSERIKKEKLRIYKTKFVEHLLNILADNSQFIDLGIKTKII